MFGLGFLASSNAMMSQTKRVCQERGASVSLGSVQHGALLSHVDPFTTLILTWPVPSLPGSQLCISGKAVAEETREKETGGLGQSEWRGVEK